ncbi:ABC transporter ATP-binding protein [Nakamurella flava]|uniref:ABC transporter ATP-binding protein n=1 Tax=Nakamurella flava TaxID=2576308 RepID=A0A4U6Q8W4_9ACTN|nr:ABC transporter ATP-binding protein [Nakamurella flava]TKV56317.1 ABC transporter ATP-binding protein [Nakamurella flava]
MTAPLLSFRDLTIAFRRGKTSTTVVHGVDIDVERGEIVALVGESGSGKTVTALSAVRLLPPTAVVDGHILLDGVDLVGLDEAALRRIRGKRIAVIFQDPSGALDPVFTVGAQLVETVRAHHPDLSGAAAKERAVELLELVGIPQPALRVKDYPHQFSGGQCQRIMIAMALAGEPDVLIADEPTTALDVTVQQEILDVVVGLRERLGMTVLLITHDMGVVADVADRVVVLRHGRVVEQAPATRLFADPQADYTRMLLAAVPRVDSENTESTGTQAAAGTPVLEIADLEVTYTTRRRTVPAVRGVDLGIAAGEIVGLVGESGSGKSTIGRAVIGLAPVTAGRIVLGGTDLLGLRGAALRAARRGIGTVFQNPAAALNPRYTVGQSIGEPLLVHEGVRGRRLEERVGDLLEAVRLPANWAARYPHELSGGQRQRVAIARAVSLRPRLLLADEPTSALDVSVQATVLELLADLQDQFAFGCLFITHDLAVVDQLCDRVVVLHQGRIVEQGTRDEILRHPTDSYTRTLLASAPVADPAVQRERRAARRPAAIPA